MRQVIGCLARSFLYALLVAGVSQMAAAEADVAALVKELNVQLQRAEKERLADPWFIKDLHRIIGKYDYPWRKQVLQQDFSDRGSKLPAPWRVTAGEFLVDWRHGLRSVVEIKAGQAAPAAQTQQGDLASALLGALINEALQTGDDRDAKEPRAADPESGQAVVIAPAAFANAFAVNVKLSSRKMAQSGTGALELGPYEGNGSQAGYRLVYHPDAAPGAASLELIRQTSSGGRSTVERFNQPVDLEDGKVHELQWTRDRDSRMNLSLDGKSVFSLVDRGYPGDFGGFGVINLGGDYAVREFRLETIE